MLEMKFAIYESVSLCIKPKKKYKPPISPPSGINKYAIRYEIVNNKFNFLIFVDLSKYLVAKKLVKINTTACINGINKKVIKNLIHPIFKNQEAITIKI